MELRLPVYLSLKDVIEFVRTVHFNGTLGYGSYIGFNSRISGEIGRFTSIADDCMVVRGRHPYEYPYVATSPMFFSMMQANWIYFC